MNQEDRKQKDRIHGWNNSNRSTQAPNSGTLLQDKFEKVVTKLQDPVQIFISTTGGSFRKPATGMWQILKKQVGAVCLSL